MVDPRTGKRSNIAKGNLCNICGTLAESHPDITTAEIQERRTVDFLFAFNWDTERHRMVNKEPYKGNISTVGIMSKSGIRVGL